MPEYKSKFPSNRKRNFCISDKFPALKEAFTDLGWIDFTDRFESENNFNFDFS